MSEDKNKNQYEGSIFDEPEKERITVKTVRKNQTRRQLEVLIAVVVIIAVALMSYFFVIKPLLAPSEEKPPEEIALLDGEVIGPQNRIFIMEYLTNDKISSVKVHNRHGEYGVNFDEQLNEFVVTGDKNAVYDREKMQALLSAAGYTLSIERITDSTDNFGEYGLSELDSPAWYEITDMAGKTHKLYIGDIIPSNNGYYVRYDGRDAVYVLDKTISDSLLAPLESLISPILAFPMQQNTYHTIDRFELWNRDEVVVSIEAIPEGQKLSDGSSLLHKFAYPEQYTPADGKYLDVFSNFIAYTGESALAYKPTDEQLDEYGLNDFEYVLHLEYNSLKNTILFSEKTDSGSRYAYSLVFDTITELPADKVNYLDWTLIDWIERPIMRLNIASVESIDVNSAEQSYSFAIKLENDVLTEVTERLSGRKVENIEIFRKFYQTLLMTEIQDYTELGETELEALTSADAAVTVTVKLINGEVEKYKFYPYETRKSHFTVNGKGDFYIIRDRMTKIVTDAAKVMSGEPIYPDANN